MKFIIYAILSSLILISCEKDELITNAGADGSSALETKTSETPSPLEQLEGLAVNIKLVSPMPKNFNYLSSSSKNNIVDRHSIDDGSLRQRWYINKAKVEDIDWPDFPQYNIKVAGGAQYNGYIGLRGGPDQYRPVLENENILTPPFLGIINIPNTSYYNIAVKYFKFDQPSLTLEKFYLHAHGSDRELVLDKISIFDSKAIWEITPVENFKLLDITYMPTPGEKFTPIPTAVTSKEVHNNHSTPLNYSTKFFEEVTETSTFSKTEGITLANKITINKEVNAPIIIDGTISSKYISDRKWAYKEAETIAKKRTMEDSVSITIPPHTSYIIDTHITAYNIDVKYTATLIGLTSGKIIKLNGRWKGVQAAEFYYNGREKTSGKSVEIPGLRSSKELNGL